MTGGQAVHSLVDGRYRIDEEIARGGMGVGYQLRRGDGVWRISRAALQAHEC